MSTTTNLKLIKYDKNETYNVNKCLNHNWDILDTIQSAKNISVLTSEEIVLTPNNSTYFLNCVDGQDKELKFSSNGLISDRKAYLFQLIIYLKPACNITFKANDNFLFWENEVEPTINEIGMYVIEIRTYNAGSHLLLKLVGKWRALRED